MEDKCSKRSPIWLHFSVLTANTAKCNLCGNKYSFKGGSTSNLKKHLETRHPTVQTRQFSKTTFSTYPSAEKGKKTRLNLKYPVKIEYYF